MSLLPLLASPAHYSRTLCVSLILCSALSAGATPDSVAWAMTTLAASLDKIPGGLWIGELAVYGLSFALLLLTPQLLVVVVAADDAYPLGRHIICPHKGVLSKEQDDFNYYFSSCRIQVECSFGILVSR